MKKIIVSALTLCCCAMLQMPVMAAETDLAIFIAETEYTVSGDVVTVPIETNGQATDGVLKLSYNADVLSVSEDDVDPVDGVDMYSVNAEEAGVLKISYLSEEPIEAGDLFVVTFEQTAETTEDTDYGFALEGESFTEDKESAGTVGVATENDSTGSDDSNGNTNTTPGGEVLGSTADNNTANSDQQTTQGAGTSDPMWYGVYAALLAGGAGLCVAASRRKAKKEVGSNEK